MIRQIPLCLAFILSLTVASTCAQAQVFSEGDSKDTPTPQVIDFGTKNPELTVILNLQDQMQLLKRLIEHETAVNAMVTAAVGIGLNDPIIPSPDLGICTSLPANIPCAQAYKDLYENYSVAKASMGKTPVPMPAPSSTIKEDKTASGDTQELPPAPEAEVAALYWTDITCLGMKCSAVISNDPSNAATRYRVSQGETLPDGSVIDSISAAGVTIKHKNKVIHVDPAPNA